MVDLIPAQNSVMRILRDTGGYRHGHFTSADGKHSSHYFKIPITFHRYDNARVLAVGLSRKFRMDASVASLLPRVAVVSPSADGIPIAFSIREALNAAQIYWATRENSQRRFPDYLKTLKINPCIVVDDIVRSGSTLRETFDLLTDLGAAVIGCGAIVKFADAPKQINGIEIKSLVEFDSPIYNTLKEWQTRDGNDAPAETIVEF